MLNKFKNAIYGPSNPTDDGSPNDQCRKPTLREQLYREISGANWNNNSQIDNNRTVNLYKGKVSNESKSREHDNIIPFLPREITRQSGARSSTPKYRYSRPEFLQLKTDDEISVSADHQIRPIILPRDVNKLPWNSGYAECINAGKSARNEDQAVCYRDVAIRKSPYMTQQPTNASASTSVNIVNEIPWTYFGIFDGHAGNAVAVAAANQLHKLIAEKIQGIVDILIALEFESDSIDMDSDSGEYLECKESKIDEIKSSPANSTNASIDKRSENSSSVIGVDLTSDLESPTTDPSISNDRQTSSLIKDAEDSGGKECSAKNQPVAETTLTLREQRANRVYRQKNSEKRSSTMTDKYRNITIAQKHNVSVDKLISGALETAFCEMDEIIAQDKREWDMRGGCTALVSLFILGKLYVCNAGDSRAIVCKEISKYQLTTHTVIPMSFDFTPTSERERILRLGQQRPEFLGTDFTHLEFLKRPTRQDLGKQMLYKDAYMTGWSMKTITYSDLKFPLVWGEGKRSRVLATIGVTRGFGDHELKAQYGSVSIKPFLTAEPEVRVLDLENDGYLTPRDVLIMGSDGLWDVTTNHEALSTVSTTSQLFPDNEESRCKYQYMTAAQDLVIQSRGHTTNWNNVWRTGDDRMASLDDITVFVIPIEQYRNEYMEWKRLRAEASAESLRETIR